MRFGFYLAWDGIRKNKRLYAPYILTCVAMVMMYYIVTFLAVEPYVAMMPGGESIQMVLMFGSWVMAIFSVIFLFYTNSFLLRRRKWEFGLYNVLGMGKWNIGRILFWDALIVAGIALVLGLGLGIALSKIFELGLARLVRGTLTYSLTVSLSAVWQTAVLFGGLFFLLFLNGLRQIRLTNSVGLLRSESAGEKPPKANWLLGILGAGLLAAAYYLAVAITNPIEALLWFFVAVVLVILATYLLFVAGSVVLCRFLQKCKNYYYKANHFVSISSMAFRMKRNGAGLASICILVTMVLVILSSTVCLYIGQEDITHLRYPRDFVLRFYPDTLEEFETLDPMRNGVEPILRENQYSAQNVLDYRVASVTGLLTGSEVETDVRNHGDYSLGTYSQTVTLLFLPLEDYNRITNTPETLGEGEVLLYANISYREDVLNILNATTYRVKKVLTDCPVRGEVLINIIPTMIVVTPDLEALEPLIHLADYNGNRMLQLQRKVMFDLEISDTEKSRLLEQLHTALSDGGYDSFSSECRDKERAGYYATFGGLFFLGLMLSAVFIAAAVLIIYYKQICEGYEDQARFGILQKVGMTHREIRKSVNSQMLTVFFLPLLTAGVHLAFAFPLLRKLLMLFNLFNVRLLMLTTGACFLIFALFYLIVYRLTSNAYFAIVSRE